MDTSKRHGFTLVEMLVVIIIIGILMAVLVPTVGMAIRKAKNSKIGLEINQLASAVDAYKAKYTDYPPDFSSRPIVERHIRKAFPSISSKEFALAQTFFWVEPTDSTSADYYRSFLDPAEALVFWLGGFSSDARRPFTGPGGPFLLDTSSGTYVTNPDRNAPQFPFDEARLSLYLADISNGNPDPAGLPWSNDEFELHTSNYADNDRFPVYFPDGLAVPYVYFDSRNYGGASRPVTIPAPQYPPAAYAGSTSIKGVATAYFSDLPTQAFMNKDKFQIVCAGLDNEYGVAGGSFPSGNGYDVENRDNLTNFSEGSTLGDKIP